MPVREVANALLLTYLGTEYLLASGGGGGGGGGGSGGGGGAAALRRMVRSWPNRACLAGTGLVNLASALHGRARGAAAAGGATRAALTAAAQTPRVCLAALAYVAALYLDCRGAQPALAPAPFAATVLAAFCRVLPVYPFLAIAISFGFLFVVSAFERLGWATDVLNLPIYYGTLYGPFSWIYWTVKRRVVRGSQELPTDRNAVLY